MINILVGKPHGFVGETHHLRKHPHSHGYLKGTFPKICQDKLVLLADTIASLVDFPLWGISSKVTRWFITSYWDVAYVFSLLDRRAQDLKAFWIKIMQFVFSLKKNGWNKLIYKHLFPLSDGDLISYDVIGDKQLISWDLKGFAPKKTPRWWWNHPSEKHASQSGIISTTNYLKTKNHHPNPKESQANQNVVFKGVWQPQEREHGFSRKDGNPDNPFWKFQAAVPGSSRDVPSMKSWLAHGNLVGGFNPSEKYESNWIISPNRDEHKKCLKPPPGDWFMGILIVAADFHL